jgi:hypothetical protein
VAWCAELADEEDIERRAKRRCHLVPHRHAPSRQRQDDDVRTVGVLTELHRQRGTPLAAISKGPLVSVQHVLLGKWKSGKWKVEK